VTLTHPTRDDGLAVLVREPLGTVRVSPAAHVEEVIAAAAASCGQSRTGAVVKRADEVAGAAIGPKLSCLPGLYEYKIIPHRPTLIARDQLPGLGPLPKQRKETLNLEAVAVRRGTGHRASAPSLRGFRGDKTLVARPRASAA
jgi:hypothetical protein